MVKSSSEGRPSEDLAKIDEFFITALVKKRKKQYINERVTLIIPTEFSKLILQNSDFYANEFIARLQRIEKLNREPEFVVFSKSKWWAKFKESIRRNVFAKHRAELKKFMGKFILTDNWQEILMKFINVSFNCNVKDKSATISLLLKYTFDTLSKPTEFRGKNAREKVRISDIFVNEPILDDWGDCIGELGEKKKTTVFDIKRKNRIARK
jgi:hypothetical protein